MPWVRVPVGPQNFTCYKMVNIYLRVLGGHDLLKSVHVLPLRGTMGCASDSETVSHEFVPHPIVSLGKRLYQNCLIQVGFWNGLESCSTIELSQLRAL